MAVTENPRCKFCGVEISWEKNSRGSWIPFLLDGSPHACKPKVKIFTKEEIEQLNKERTLDQSKKQHG